MAPQKNSWRGTWLPKGVPQIMQFTEIGTAQRHEWGSFFSKLHVIGYLHGLVLHDQRCILL